MKVGQKGASTGRPQLGLIPGVLRMLPWGCLKPGGGTGREQALELLLFQVLGTWRTSGHLSKDRAHGGGIQEPKTYWTITRLSLRPPRPAFPRSQPRKGETWPWGSQLTPSSSSLSEKAWRPQEASSSLLPPTPRLLAPGLARRFRGPGRTRRAASARPGPPYPPAAARLPGGAPLPAACSAASRFGPVWGGDLGAPERREEGGDPDPSLKAGNRPQAPRHRPAPRRLSFRDPPWAATASV